MSVNLLAAGYTSNRCHSEQVRWKKRPKAKASNYHSEAKRIFQFLLVWIDQGRMIGKGEGGSLGGEKRRNRVSHGIRIVVSSTVFYFVLSRKWSLSGNSLFIIKDKNMVVIFSSVLRIGSFPGSLRSFLLY